MYRQSVPRRPLDSRAIGIDTVGQFTAASARQLTDRLGVDWITLSTIRRWQSQATLMCQVPGLNSRHAQLLSCGGYAIAQQIARCEPVDLHREVSQLAATSAGRRCLRGAASPTLAEVKAWISAAASTEVGVRRSDIEFPAGPQPAVASIHRREPQIHMKSGHGFGRACGIPWYPGAFYDSSGREFSCAAFEASQYFFDVAADHLSIDDDLREALLMPHREVQVQVTIRRDDGRLANFVGFRVQHDHYPRTDEGWPSLPP